MTPKYKQGDVLLSIRAFKAGRMRIKPGERFVVTNTQIDQDKTGAVQWDRKKTARISCGKYFRPEDMDSCFVNLRTVNHDL